MTVTDMGDDDAGTASALMPRVGAVGTGPQGTARKSASADNINRLQVEQTVKAIPLLLLFHASAILSIQNVGGLANTGTLQTVWYIMAVVVGLGFATMFALWRRRSESWPAGRVLRTIELFALLLGLVWATPIAAATGSANASVIFPIAGISLAMMGIGVISMIRVPVGAVIFTALMASVLGRSLYTSLPDNQVMAALVCAIYGLVLIGVTVNSHWDFLRRSRAEMEVQHQKQVIKLLLNDFERGSSDWLWETNAAGVLTHYSPRFAEVLGVTVEDMQGKTLPELLQPAGDAEAVAAVDAALVRQEAINNLPLTLSRGGVRTHWHILAHPLLDENGRVIGMRGVGRDLTLTLDAQHHMEQAMQASERANAAKSQFLAVVSHELRTPINAIVGFSELLAKDGDATLPAATRREFCDTIVESSRHLQLLINDLLDATRIERGTLKLVEQDNDACELVEVAIKLCRAQAEKNGVTIVGRLTEYITLTGDMTRLQQVIINLLTNAIKFSPKGGVVNVEMMRGSDAQFILAVRDAGEGISQDDLQRVFDPFVQVEQASTRRYGGIGLGLSIARRIARLHDGDVRLESAPGSGTTAYLILPNSRVAWPKAGKAAQSVA